MSLLGELVLGIAAGALTAPLLAAASVGYKRYMFRDKHSLLFKSLEEYATIQIVLPFIYLPSFEFGLVQRHVSKNSPHNILFMPFAEASAISELTNVLNRLFPKKSLRLIKAGEQDASLPIISVGGPSVNEFTEKVLQHEFPEFSINYPDTTHATYRGATFSSACDSAKNNVTRDYGFVFIGKTLGNAPCYVACGILAFGTQVAVRHLINMRANTDEGRGAASGKTKFISVEASVNEYNATSGAARTLS